MVSRMRRRRSSTFQKENYRRLTAQGIGAQYHSPVIALAGHMVKRSGQFHSRLSRHRSDKTTPIKQNESLTPPPPLQYHPPVIALADHMVKRSGQFHSWLSRHRSDKTAPIKQNESLTPPPPSGSTIPPGTLQNPDIIPRARSNMSICPP